MIDKMKRVRIYIYNMLMPKFGLNRNGKFVCFERDINLQERIKMNPGITRTN